MVRLLSRVSFFCLLCMLFTSAAHGFAKRIIPVTATTENSGAGYRFDRGGWTYVHLEGTPAEIGFEHGSLLAAEIADLVASTSSKRSTARIATGSSIAKPAARCCGRTSRPNISRS